MKTRICFAAVILAALAAAAHGQIVSATVDILSPGEDGYGGLPANLVVIDYFVDVAETDVWIGAGTRVLTENGATLVYADYDPNTSGVQVTLINPGLNQRYTTSVSRPRVRNGNARFTNSGADIAGGYPTAAAPATSPTHFEAWWTRFPPANPTTPSEDGYVARIAINLGAAGDRRDFLLVSENPPPDGSIIYGRCVVPGFPWGWANATFDVPALGGRDWYLFDPVPEPATFALLLCGAALLNRSRSGNNAPRNPARGYRHALESHMLLRRRRVLAFRLHYESSSRSDRDRSALARRRRVRRSAAGRGHRRSVR